MKSVKHNLNVIKRKIEDLPDPNSLKTNDDFMSFWIELMSDIHYILNVGVAFSEKKKAKLKGFHKHKAIVLGEVVRMVKLYDAFIKHTAEREVELSLIFVRLIFETEVKVDYFMNCASFRKAALSYIISTYRSDKENFKDLIEKSKTRGLENIELSILSSVKTKIKADNITQKQLLANTKWKLDGKDFRSILQSLGREFQYSYTFGSMSNFVHGSWQESKIYHLDSINGRYYPKLDYTDPDPRITGPISFLTLVRLKAFIIWNKSKATEFLIEYIDLMIKTVVRYDTAYGKKRYGGNV